MIPSIRRKFIVIAMVSMIGTMTVLCAAIGASNYYATANRMDRGIFILYQNGGTFFPPGSHSDPSDFNFQVTPETAFETRYFIGDDSRGRGRGIFHQRDCPSQCGHLSAAGRGGWKIPDGGDPHQGRSREFFPPVLHPAGQCR